MAGEVKLRGPCRVESRATAGLWREGLRVLPGTGGALPKTGYRLPAHGGIYRRRMRFGHWVDGILASVAAGKGSVERRGADWKRRAAPVFGAA